MARTVKALIFAGFLSGCAASEAPPPGPLQLSQEMVALKEQRDSQKCQKLGANPGTKAYTDCRLKLEEFAREDARLQAEWSANQIAANEARRQAALRDYMAFSAANRPPPLQPIQAPTPIKQPMICESRRQLDGSMKTVCN